jgi:hypothetical protein
MPVIDRAKRMERLYDSGFTHLVIPSIIIIVIALLGGIVYEQISKATTVTNMDYLQSGIAGKCLDDAYDTKTNGTKVQLYTCNKSAAQQWTVNTNGTIENANGACLDLAEAKDINNTKIVMYSCNSNAAQQWEVINNTLLNPESSKCIDDPYSTTTNGTQLILYTCKGTTNQKWTAVSASGSGSGSGGSTTTASDFVSASGTNLRLSGKDFQFIGFDAYGMEGCWNGVSGTAWTNAQLDTYFASLPSNGMTRIWAEQSYGTAVISNIVTQAAKYKQHLILSISNDDGNCDPTTDDPNQSGEPLSFYQTGWKTQYVNWVKTIVPLFANNPAVAMWEISNEPGQSTSVPEATMQTYMNGAAAAIKAVDPHQLIETGFNDVANSNNQTQGRLTDYENVQSNSDINVISFHDYAYDYENKATLSSHFTDAQAAAKALDKPFIAGEAGVEAGTGCALSLTQRVTYLETKASDYFKGTGLNGTSLPDSSGIMFWDYVPDSPSGNCSANDYDFYPTDPMVTSLKSYILP